MALTEDAPARFASPSTPTLIRVAAGVAACGIGLSITEYADYGKWLTVAGVLLLIVALHRFGRSGPDQTIVFELAPGSKKKKKKRRPPTDAPREEPEAANEAAKSDDSH